MADTITVTVPELAALVGDDSGDLIAVWRGDGLGRVPRSAIRGTRLFTGPTNPPVTPAVLAALNPALLDRWRNTITGDEWKVTSLNPFVWEADGSVKGNPGEAQAPFQIAEASEALVAGQSVNLHSGTTIVRVRKADSGTPNGGRKTDGFILTDASAGDRIPVYGPGLNTALTGLTPGADYWMGPNGSVVTPEPAAQSGRTKQFIGKASSPTSLDVKPGPFVATA